MLMIPPAFRPPLDLALPTRTRESGTYREAAAEDSWTRAMKFFGAQIGGLKSA